MLSKAQNKYIRSLSHQKYRKEHNVFVAEGDKIVKEWLVSDASIQMIVSLEAWASDNQKLIQKHPEASLHIVEEHELTAISTLKTANGVLLVVNNPITKTFDSEQEWCIALDNIQDPGNMGTIIRIADWFGIKHILCTRDCVDIYNPKVVQSAMGGHLRVNIYTVDLQESLQSCRLPVYAATLGGTNIYNVQNAKPGILVIGNESKGISDSILSCATQQVTIPRKGGAESLNAGVSAGILCALLLGS